MSAAATPTKTKGGTTFPPADAIPYSWLQLRHEFRADFERAPSARLFHALQIRSGIPADEPEADWRPLLEHCAGMPSHNKWFNTHPRRGATRGLQHCPLGERDLVTADLIRTADDLVKSDPLTSGLRTDSFLLLHFLVAWERPHDVSYRIEQAAFNLRDFPVDHRPFDSLEAFERWEVGELGLEGRYFLWLNRDVRLCAVSAIDALFHSGMRLQDDTVLRRSDRLEVDVLHCVAKIDGVDHRLQPHEAQILNAVVEAKESGDWWVTGPQMELLPGCRGKKISRVFAQLECRIAILKELIDHGGNKGYRLKE